MAANAFDLTALLMTEVQDSYWANINALRFANRKFEGALKVRGDTVKVEEFDVALVTGTTTNVAIANQSISTTAYSIQVSQAKEAAYVVPSIDELRSAFGMEDSIIYKLGKELAESQETHFLAQLAADAGNTVTTAALASNTIVSKIESMAQLLNEDNAPMNRVLFLTPAAVSALRQSGYLVYTDKGFTTIESADAPNIAGFTCYMSNLLPSNTIIGFCVGEPNFIDQLSYVDAVERQGRKGALLRCESYYQAKTVGTKVNAIVKHVYS